MKRDLDRVLSLFYAFERKNKAIKQDLSVVQEEIYNKLADEHLKGLFDKYIAMCAKNEYEQKKRLIDFVYSYFDMFDEE